MSIFSSWWNRWFVTCIVPYTKFVESSSPLLALRKWLFWEEFTCFTSNISILQLIQNLKPSRVVILTSAPVCEYHTRDPGNITSDFVKVLKTKAWQEKFSQKECSYLETPNIIKGQAASGQIFFFNCRKDFAGASRGGTKGILGRGCVARTPQPIPDRSAQLCYMSYTRPNFRSP